MCEVALHDVVRAAAVIRGLVRRTPLEASPPLDAVTGATTFLKLENLQVTGSFKVRGALSCVASLDPGQRELGLLAASSGNHAQGLAYAARHFACRATVFVPEGTPKVKLDNCRRLGASIVIAGRDYDEAQARAAAHARTTPVTWVHGFADPRVIAGQGTVALEMLAERPDLEIFLVPAGGGGLIAGVATVVKAFNPQAKVIGVQSVASAPWYHSFRAGKLVHVELGPSIAEGLHGGITDPPFGLVMRLVDDFVLVEEAEIAAAVRWLALEHHLVVEPSGAVGVAALLAGRLGPVTGRRVAVVISGGNVDPACLAAILSGLPR